MGQEGGLTVSPYSPGDLLVMLRDVAPARLLRKAAGVLGAGRWHSQLARLCAPHLCTLGRCSRLLRKGGSSGRVGVVRRASSPRSRGCPFPAARPVPAADTAARVQAAPLSCPRETF